MAQELVLGPAFLFLGDPTQASGAGLTYLGETRGDVIVTPGIRSAATMSDQRGGAELADGNLVLPPDPEVVTPLIDFERAKLLAQLPDAEEVTGTGGGVLNFGSAVTTHTPDTLCILPVFEKADGVNAAHAIWIPAARLMEFGEITYRLPDDGGEVTTPRSARWKGQYRAEDQGATAIPEKARIMMMGDPTDNSLTWSLPSTLPDGTTIGS